MCALPIWLERALHDLDEQVAMLADQGVIAGPIPVAAEQMEQLTPLVELLAVRRLETLSNHGHAVPADHFGEHVLQNVACRLEMSGVERAESSVRSEERRVGK